jgi:aminoglycoside phosphotransferase
MNENNYGFRFNDITINNNGSLTKKSKNTHGTSKINNEIQFYLYITSNAIDFPMPQLIHHEDGELTIQYIPNATALTYHICPSNIDEYIDKIKKHLRILHSVEKQVSFDSIKKDVIIEIKQKIIDRFNEFDWETNEIYHSIKSVNNINIRDIYHYCEVIKNRMSGHLTNDRTHYHLIHGDVHLGNILLDENEQLFFIDPRGYFGESKLYGLCEYDYAKLLFGLSGYSRFDNMNIENLQIVNGNLEIDFIKDYESIFETKHFDEMTTLFCLSIWLANNSCFSNVNKKIMSLMIAYYYCEKYLPNNLCL